VLFLWPRSVQKACSLTNSSSVRRTVTERLRFLAVGTGPHFGSTPQIIAEIRSCTRFPALFPCSEEERRGTYPRGRAIKAGEAPSRPSTPIPSLARRRPIAHCTAPRRRSSPPGRSRYATRIQAQGRWPTKRPRLKPARAVLVEEVR